MDLNRQELLSQLRQMDEYEFEKLVADVWDEQGWETTVTTGSSDRGIDVIAEKSSPFKQKHVIQAKRYSGDNKIGGPAVRNYEALKRQEDDVDAVVIVTTSSFTSQAKQIGSDLNVKLIDGENLCAMIFGLSSKDHLSNYINTPMKKEKANSTITTEKSNASSGSASKKELNNTPKWFRGEGKTSIFGSLCPLCGSDGSMHEGTWIDNTQVDNKEAVFCTSCETTWKKETKGMIFKNKVWVTESGTDKKKSEWKEMSGS